MRIIVILLVSLTFSACASKGPKKPYECKGEFHPINGMTTAAALSQPVDIKC